MPQPRPCSLHQPCSRPGLEHPSRSSLPPQEFLKKEFSAENVYFWQACERFQQIPASDTQQVPAPQLRLQIPGRGGWVSSGQDKGMEQRVVPRARCWMWG